jgi:hypothetical protein
MYGQWFGKWGFYCTWRHQILAQTVPILRRKRAKILYFCHCSLIIRKNMATRYKTVAVLITAMTFSTSSYSEYFWIEVTFIPTSLLFHGDVPCLSVVNTHLKKSSLQKTWPFRAKHLSLSCPLHSLHLRHFACHVRSSTFRMKRSRISSWQPPHFGMLAVTKGTQDTQSHATYRSASWG